MSTSAACVSWFEALLNHSLLNHGGSSPVDFNGVLDSLLSSDPDRRVIMAFARKRYNSALSSFCCCSGSVLEPCLWTLVPYFIWPSECIWLGWWIQYPSPSSGGSMHLYAKKAMLYFWISSSACYADFPFGSCHWFCLHSAYPILGSRDSRVPSHPVLLSLNPLLCDPYHARCKSRSLGLSVSVTMFALPCPRSSILSITSSLLANTCPGGCYLLDLLVLPPQGSALSATSLVESPLTPGVGLVKPTTGLSGFSSALWLTPMTVH